MYLFFFFLNSSWCITISRFLHPVSLLVFVPAPCQRCSPGTFSVTSKAALWVTHKAAKCHYLGELVGGKGSFLVRHKTTHLSSLSLLQIISCARDCCDELISIIYFLLAFITKIILEYVQVSGSYWRLCILFFQRLALGSHPVSKSLMASVSNQWDKCD